jgi:GntR family transcriptional regulator
MPRTHADPRSRQQKIAAELRAQIMSGDLAPGAQLPTIAELESRFEVANATVQKALAVLKDEGVIVSRHGRGVFVSAAPQQAIDTVATVAPANEDGTHSWIAEASRRGVAGTSKLLNVAEVVPPHEVQEAFGLTLEEKAVLRKRLMLFDDVPVEVNWSYYPLSLARGTALASNKKIKGGSPQLLAELGYPSVEMVDLVSWRPPTEEEFVLLELPTEVPVGRTFRVIYSHDTAPVEATVMVKAGHLYRLLYRVPLT